MESKSELQLEYSRLYKTSPDRRWGAETLQEKIDVKKEFDKQQRQRLLEKQLVADRLRAEREKRKQERGSFEKFSEYARTAESLDQDERALGRMIGRISTIIYLREKEFTRFYEQFEKDPFYAMQWRSNDMYQYAVASKLYKTIRDLFERGLTYQEIVKNLREDLIDLATNGNANSTSLGHRNTNHVAIEFYGRFLRDLEFDR